MILVFEMSHSPYFGPFAGAYPLARPQEHWLEGLHCLQMAPDPQTQNRTHQVSVDGQLRSRFDLVTNQQL